ncbi:MAG: hypothetical protein ACK4M3_01505 [Pyrobaculum sp.]
MLNISEVAIGGGLDAAVLRTRNPYLAVVYGSVAKRVVNSPASIISALNRAYWIQRFGPPHAVISSDAAVEKIDVAQPWLLLTAWRLGLDGVVTSVEGAKSVVEHRTYMKNPLAKASIIVPRPRGVKTVFATAKNARGIVADLLAYLELQYARVTLGDYGDRWYVIDVDPVPPLGREEALLLAEVI